MSDEFQVTRDPILFDFVEDEKTRQQNVVELIASENFVSPYVLEAMGSVLTNKYAEGYPDHRYYGGCGCVDQVEYLAIQRALDIFGAEHANVQPHSGSQANMAAYASVLNPGDAILSMSMDSGGHLTHSSPVSFVTKLYKVVTYGTDKTGLLDYDAIMETAKACRPKLIVAGASAYPRLIDFKEFRHIADEVGAYLMVDMAHIAGLVAAGLHPSPVPYADIVTATTHKTLRGPRGGLILCKQNLAKAVDKAVFPGTQGGPFMHIIAAKAQCFYEAALPSFRKYQYQVLTNAHAMQNVFIQEHVHMVTGGTSNHLILLDLRNENVNGKQLQDLLSSCAIAANKNAVPNDPRPFTETSGLRIGTPAMTTRGFTQEDFVVVAKCIAELIRHGDKATDSVYPQIQALLQKINS